MTYADLHSIISINNKRRAIMALVVLALLFSVGNAEFNNTVAEQKAAGFKWYNLPECRVVTKGLPAITVDSVKGKSVCYKLALTKEEAK